MDKHIRGDIPIWWDYAIFHPEEDEEGFDGVHYGGIKGIRNDSPADVKKAYADYLDDEKEFRRLGIKV